MNTLHTFGCSFTAPYTIDGRVEYRQYFNYKGGKFPKIWPNILSEKLNSNLNNLGIIGSSNYDIFSDFCKNINNFKEGDVVIVGWTYKERFRLVNEIKDIFVKISPNSRPKLNNITNNTIDEMLVNRGNHIWVSEVINWEKLMKKSLDSSGVKLLTWSFDSSFPKNTFIFDNLIKLGAETIQMETKNTIPDHHMGENGHIAQSNYFYEILENNNKDNYVSII